MGFNFSPFPGLQTERYILRPLDVEDENDIFFLRSDSHNNEFLDRPIARSVEDARQFIFSIADGIKHGDAILWVIEGINGPSFLGTICLWKISEKDKKAEIGYELLPAHHGKGIMQEVIPAVISWAFNSLGLKLVEAELSTSNVKSLKLLEKNNFRRNKIFDEGKLVSYQLINPDEAHK
jgi:ribosomal-protein-alanine N-acetyltransferase